MGEKPRIRASFSGGRSSALMCEVLQKEYGDTHEIVYTFCNTSWERPETLDFANAVDRHLGLNLVWLEAVVHPGRKSCTHRVVSYETAKRNGEVFDAVAAKYGLPNQVFKWCTRELKTNVMNSYARSIGWLPGTYDTAIGIRADEPRRVRRDVAERERIIYPLVDIRYVTKEDVLDHFEGQPWNLKIEEHQGNCIACYKKSDRKLYTLYREDPRNFDFPIRLDQLYRNVGPNNVPGPRKMYRGYESAPDLVARFEAAGPSYRPPITEGGCSESCEVYETEQFELFAAERPIMTNQQGAPEALRFTKKPVTIEAIQWTGKNLREVITFTDGPPDTRSHHAGMAWEAYADLVARDGLKIYTLEGKMLANVGDWIIRGVKGEFYPCKPDIFEATYSPATLVEAQQPAPSAAAAGWWRKRANEIEAQVAMTGSPEAMRCFTDMLTLLQAATVEAPQPSPTPHAASQPAPVRDYPPLPEPQYQMGGKGHSDAAMRAYVDADRAARTPADSVTAPAGGLGWKLVPMEITDAMRNAAAQAGMEALDLRDAGASNVGLVPKMYEAMLAAAPTPPAQAADSVLEDAARLAKIMQAIRDYHFALDNREHGGVAMARAWNAICDVLNMDWVQGAESAARKQGANHD